MLHITLTDVNYDVLDGVLPPPRPDLPPLPVKLVRFVDPQSGIVVDVPLPKVKGPDAPPEFVPAAEAIGRALLDNKPQVQIAQAIPMGAPPAPGGPPPPSNRHQRRHPQR